jgi:hypothetical protein
MLPLACGSLDQKTLYVSETVGNCILKFSINPTPMPLA